MPKRSPQRKPQLKPMDLMATTAHELKSPLVLINGLADMLAEGAFGDLNSRQQRYINRIDTASERLLLMVENLLTVNRSHHGRLTIDRAPVSVIAVLGEVVRELEPRFSMQRITLVWSPHLRLPPVLADAQLVQQIFYNLLDNTLKYSPPASTVSLRFSHSPGFLHIQVRDQGFGIKQSELDKIFSRFGSFQKPISTQASSSGLGLFIVKNLVEVLGGEVKVRRLRRGSSFTVSLPLVQQLELFTLPLKSEATDES